MCTCVTRVKAQSAATAGAPRQLQQPQYVATGRTKLAQALTLSDVSGKLRVCISAGTQTLDVFRGSLQSRHANAVTLVSDRPLAFLFYLLPQIFLAAQFTI
jgi:hypothetical protein